MTASRGTPAAAAGREVRRAAIKDVARLAGVAVGTVSNVLNRPESVGATTRALVEDAILKLDYVPNPTARQLRSGEIKTIGAVVLNLANPFFTDIARGVEDRLAQDSFTLMMASSDESLEREQRYLDLFVSHGVRGVLVTPSGTDLAHLRRLQHRGADVVLLDHFSTEMPSVGVDDVVGGALAAAHLLDGGRDRIAFLNGPLTVRQCASRRDGLVRTLLERGLDAGTSLTEITLPPPLDTAVAARATHELLDGPGPAPTGIFCINDVVAMGVLRALRDRGVDVPGDIAVVGYDDVDFASMLATPLTSVRQPTRRLGWTAADLMLRGAEGGDQHQEFAPELVVRASTGW